MDKAYCLELIGQRKSRCVPRKELVSIIAPTAHYKLRDHGDDPFSSGSMIQVIFSPLFQHESFLYAYFENERASPRAITLYNHHELLLSLEVVTLLLLPILENGTSDLAKEI
jgi:hypothetical protein